MENSALKTFVDNTEWNELIDGIISDRRDKNSKLVKVKFRPVKLKDRICIQVTEYIDTKVIHTNL